MDGEFRHRRTLVFHAAFFLFNLVSCTYCEEQPVPEIYLQPRHFNPHPYEVNRASSLKNRGPVLFPRNPEDEENEVQSNIVTIPKSAQSRHPVDDHPYPKVARKHRYRVAGRYNDQENQVNPRVYEGLSNHAAKVLSTPPSQLGKDYILDSLSRRQQQQKNYAFSYKVVDHLTGDDFSHTQSRNSKATSGEYRVKLPDGRVQIVSYTADRNGYKADVKYAGDEEAAPPPQDTQIQQIPFVSNQIKPVASNSFDYQYDDIGVSNLQKQVPVYVDSPVVYDPAPRAKISLNYRDYVTPTPTTAAFHSSSPGYYVEKQPQSHGVVYPAVAVQIVPQHKVQINDQRQSYISSTASPYTLENPKDYELNVVSSTVSPNPDGYSEVYISTPKYRIETKSQHRDLYYKK